MSSTPTANARTAAELEAEALDFAQQIQGLLRDTVCPGAVLEYKSHRRPRLIQPVGEIRPSNGDDLPVRWTPGKAIASLRIKFNVTFDEHKGRYLMVFKSMFAIVAAQVSNAPIVRWEFDRDKRGFSPAHFQVHAESSDLKRLQEMAGREKPMHDVHFPAGSKRYRPALEDVIEFVVQEGSAHPLDGWDVMLQQSRERYERNQLRSVVATHPDVAIDKLEEEGILTTDEATAARGRMRPT